MPTPPTGAAHRGTRHAAEPRPRHAWAAGFTLTELLVVVTVLLVLVALLMPVLGRALGQARRVVCISNLRQLATAWINYQADNGGRIIGACDGQWVGAGGTDDSVIANYQLYPYVGSVKLYRCPSDPWPHLRTYSLNAYLNGCEWQAIHAQPPATLYAQLRNPSATFVFIEEYDARGWNIDSFLVNLPWQPAAWVDCPACWHFQGINLAFADGHVECWTWRDPRTLLLDGGHDVPSPGNPDLLRLVKSVGSP